MRITLLCKYLLLIILISSLGTPSMAQAPVIEWQISYGGTEAEEAMNIIQLADSSYIAIGYTQSNNGDITAPVFGNTDVLVVKLSPLGVVQWSRVYGGSSYDFGVQTLPTFDGGYLLLGRAASQDGNVSYGRGQDDFWVIKVSSTGAIQWEKTYGGTAVDLAINMIPSYSGGYMIGGFGTSNNMDFPANHGGYDISIAKVADNGALEWTKSLGGTGHDYVGHIEQTADSGYILTGYTNSNNGNVSGALGGWDYWVAKLSATGTVLWQKCLGGQNNDYGIRIKPTPDNGFIVAGKSNSNSGHITQNNGGYDIWVLKLDSVGNITWQKNYGGSNDEMLENIALTADGGYVLAGYTQSNNGDVTGNHGNEDGWVVKLSPLGILEWQKTLGSTGYDRIYNVTPTADGGYMLAGRASANNGDITGHHGSMDFWLVKLYFPPEIATDTLANLTYCQGDSLWVRFTQSGHFNTGNQYTVQLSDSNGSFTNPVDIGSIMAATDSAPIAAVLPMHLPVGSQYRIRVVSSSPQVVGTDNGENITIRAPSGSVVYDTICSGQSYNFNGLTLTIAGSYYDTLLNAVGCDSTVTLHLTVTNYLLDSVSEVICFGDSYFFNNQYITSAGTYSDTVVGSGGCDSITLLLLSVLPENRYFLSKTICQGDSFENHHLTGTYVDTFTSVAGCDSIRVLSLFVDSIKNEIVAASICEGDTLNGHTTTGIYTDTLVGFSGCDSIRTLKLYVQPPLNPTISINNNVLSVVDSFDSYQWYLDGSLLSGEEADTIVANSYGSYTVVVTSSGCTGTSDTFNFTGIGIGEMGTSWGFEIYPNPTNGMLNLILTGTPIAQWGLYNYLGQQLLQGTTHENASIDVGTYAEGVYYIKVQAGSTLLTQKIILVK